VCIYWAPRDLDEIAWVEHDKVVKWAIEESERLEAETVERRANGERRRCFKATFGIFAFPSPTHSEVKAHELEKRKPERETGRGAKDKRKASKAKAKSKASRASRGSGKQGKS
jgi:hypothetical protein